MMNINLWNFVGYVVLCLLFAFPDVKADVQQFGAGRFTAPDGFTLKYRFYRPENPAKRKGAPLVVLMHGAGSIGDDNTSHLFFTRLFCRFPQSPWREWNILSPQCPTGHVWVRPGKDWTGRTYRFQSQPTPALGAVQLLIRKVCKDWQVDPRRIFVGGCSMGGYATWELIVRNPGYFAGAFPICGGTDVSTASLAARTPVRVFHGADDQTVLPENSREMVKALKALGADVIYKEYPGVKHASWQFAMMEKSLYEWLVKCHR